MHVKLNGQDVACANEDLKLKDFIVQNDLSDRSGIAVAVNLKVIPKKDWQNTMLIDNDEVLIITATQGG